MEKANFKFRVDYWEYEAGWGSRLDESKEFDTYEEAIQAINKFNAYNDKETVPAWYMVAKAGNFEIKNERRVTR